MEIREGVYTVERSSKTWPDNSKGFGFYLIENGGTHFGECEIMVPDEGGHQPGGRQTSRGSHSLSDEQLEDSPTPFGGQLDSGGVGIEK